MNLNFYCPIASFILKLKLSGLIVSTIGCHMNSKKMSCKEDNS